MQPALQQIGALASLARVEPGVGLAGLLLRLERFGQVVPVSDFFGQPVFNGSLGFGNEFELVAAYISKVRGHDMGDGVALGLLLQFTVDPGAFGPVKNGGNGRLVGLQWPMVE